MNLYMALHASALDPNQDNEAGGEKPTVIFNASTVWTESP